MRASMCADGTASHLRCDLLEITGFDGTGGTKVDPHTAGSDAKTQMRRSPGCD